MQLETHCRKLQGTDEMKGRIYMSIDVCRTADNESFPPISSTTIIVDNELNVLMKSGGTMSKGDARQIISEFIPKAEKKEFKIILVWRGQWRDDAFELRTKEELKRYEDKLLNYLY